MGHRSEKPENVRVVHQVRDDENIRRVQANIIIEPASGMTSFYSYLLITTVVFVLLFFKNNPKPLNRSQLPIRHIFVDRGRKMEFPTICSGKFHVTCRSNFFDDFDRFFCFHNMDAAQPPNFKWAIHGLEFKTNVTIFVSARNAGNERSSNNHSLSFTTPSCAQMLDDAFRPGIRGKTIVFSCISIINGFFAVKCKLKNIILRKSITP